jgi:hypothetical protein
VAGVADLTGDGRGELMIGAYREDPNAAPDNAGRVYIYNGASGVLLKTLVSPNQTANGFFGTSVAGVPDVTGDGRADLVVGAPGESLNGLNAAGRVYVYDGAARTLFKTLVSGNPAPNAGFGFSVAGAPDVNGDSRGEVLVGAPLEFAGVVPAAGRAYLFSGATGVRLRTFSAGSPETGDAFGASVAGLSDINGDGRGDIAIGSPGADPVGAPDATGRIHVYSGASGAYLRGIGSPGAQTNGRFGASIAAVPDVNGNGKGDLLAGAPLEDTQTTADVGRAYLVRN